MSWLMVIFVDGYCVEGVHLSMHGGVVWIVVGVVGKM